MKNKFEVGRKVTYKPKHTKPEKGIIKSIAEDGKAYFVVYNCNDEWHRYKEFTAALTNERDLIAGWHE